MNWLEALILGIVQGITEFLPISSTAHLVLVEKLLGMTFEHQDLSFELFLHLASLAAVLVYFRRDLATLWNDFFQYAYKRNSASKTNFRFVMLMIVTTLITMIVGKGLELLIGDKLLDIATIGASLIVTGLFLILIEHGSTPGTRAQRDMTMKDAVIVGIGQSLAVIPGISRSGSTLIVALWCGLDKQLAVRYSFLLSIPIILGISLIKIPDLITSGASLGVELIIALHAAFIFAIIGIRWLISMVQQAKLTYFAIYCILAGASAWIFL